MKMKNKAPRRHGWLWAWLIQIALMLAVGAVVAICFGVHPAAFAIAQWAVMPLAGAVSACRAVRRGLSNYLAWIAPPACFYLAHYLLWGYAPSAGAALLCAFVSLVGAATGEVMNQRRSHR